MPSSRRSSQGAPPSYRIKSESEEENDEEDVPLASLPRRSSSVKQNGTPQPKGDGGRPHPTTFINPTDPVNPKKVKGVLKTVMSMHESFFFREPVVAIGSLST